MNTRTCKAKGRRFQQEVRDKILELFPQLTSRDVISTSMGDTGEDIKLSEAAVKLFPYSVECKNQERLNIWAGIKQMEGDNRNLTPLLVFKKNRTPAYCALKFEDFMVLVHTLKIAKAIMDSKTWSENESFI